MKKSMIFAAMAAVALVSCNNNDFLGEGDETTDSSQRVEIKVGQNVDGIETKSGLGTRAAINTGDEVEALIIATNGAAPGDWARFTPVTENTFNDGDTWDAVKFANVATGIFNAGTDQDVNISPSLYANPTNGATLTGIAPKGRIEGGKVIFSKIDGEQDVMVAKTTAKNDVTITPSPAIDPFQLTFEHKTAQLRFSFAATNRAGDGAWSPATDKIEVKSVTVIGAGVPRSIGLGGEYPIEWLTQDVILKDMKIKNILTSYGTTPNTPDFITIDKAALVAPVNPGSGADPVKLKISILVNNREKVYTNIIPKKVGGGDLVTKEGFYHNIKLTIKQPATPTGTPEITATATVTPWGEGDEGSADLN